MATKRALRIKNRSSRRIRVALENRRYGNIDLSGVIERTGQSGRHAIDIDLSSMLEYAEEEDVDTIKPLLGDLLRYHYWVVRADAMQFVAKWHLDGFLRPVKAALNDKNWCVRDYALAAYYDLVGPKALPLLKKAAHDRSVSYRVTAFVLRYVETRDEVALRELRKILMWKRCRYTNRYAALCTFDAYVDVGQYPEIIQLFEELLNHLAETPWGSALDRDIRTACKKWKRSARKRRKTSEERP